MPKVQTCLSCCVVAVITVICAESPVLGSDLDLKKAPGAKPRNIVFILVDDLRHDVFGFTGHPFTETPHIDSLAKNGVHMKNAFVTTALCSPSRATILTGLYV